MKSCKKIAFYSFISGYINFKGLFFSKHGSNAYDQWYITSSKKLLLPSKFWSLKIEQEWLLMKFCKKNLLSLLLVEILICKGLFLSKISKSGSNTYDNCSKTAYTQRIMVFESLTILVINEVLWKNYPELFHQLRKGDSVDLCWQWTKTPTAF